MYIIILLLLPYLIYSKLRVGHLISFGDEERQVLAKCVNTSSIELVLLDACEQFNGLENAVQFHYNLGVDILTGAYCDEESETISQLALRWNKLYLSTSTRLTASRQKTTISLQPDTIEGLAHSLIGLAWRMRWMNLSIVHDTSNMDNAQRIASAFQSHPRIQNISIDIEIGEYHWFSQILTKSRVLIVLCSADIFVNEMLPNILEFERPNEFIILFLDQNKSSPDVLFEKLHQRKHQPYPFIYLIQSIHKNTTSLERWASLNNLTMGNELFSNLLICDTLNVLNKMDVVKDKSIGHLWEIITQHTDYGYTGPIFISPEGGRLPFLIIYSYLNGTAVPAALLNPVQQDCSSDSCIWHKLIETEYTSRTLFESPSSFPKCSYDGSSCESLPLTLTILIISTILTIPILIIFHFYMKNRKIKKMPWRIGHEHITFKNIDNDHPGFRRISTASSQKISTSTNPDFEEKKFAYLDGSKMYIHVYNQKRAITFSRKEMERLNQLIYLHHVNINTFAGVAFNQQSQLVSLWSFCVRGSLDDIIFSSDRELGRNFQATFIKHILNGVQYIHQSSIKAHGALFLSNCVVDGYWVVKLTDFGLKGILHNKMVHKDLIAGSYDSLEDLPRCYLQYPPEYLETIKKHKDVYAIEPTVHGDIYQIGMLIYQILFVRRPFCERRESVEEIIDLVTSSSSPFHPVLPEKSPDLTLRLVSIIQQCWLVKTSARPALFKIIDAIAREFGKQGGTLIDQLIKMVDEYSDNLEQIVAERISRIEEERFRTQQILHQVMPREVAEALCDGQQLKPRLHPSVTILMVDVCQFSELCESCIPVHVLEILQQLYSSFDQIILKFKAFKVENVGDAYLVVSGIPDLPDNLHLTEICRISLELKKFMKTLVVLHRPDYTLRVKMGISYGAVAAGVLGLTAPRFCVFGESVNMACRMAGTGVPSKIQVSENASELIQRDFPEFRMEERGTVILKGKGPVTTFWLLDNTEDATPMDPHNVN